MQLPVDEDLELPSDRDFVPSHSHCLLDGHEPVVKHAQVVVCRREGVQRLPYARGGVESLLEEAFYGLRLIRRAEDFGAA